MTHTVLFFGVVGTAIGFVVALVTFVRDVRRRCTTA